MPMFNNFPVTYQNPYYQQQAINQMNQQANQMQPPVNQPQAPSNNLIWVQGEAGAKSYLVAPNTTVQLWDSEAQVIYLKSADASGMPSIKTLDYTIRNENPPIQAVSHEDNKYISREEFEALKGDLGALQAELNKLKPRNGRKEEKHHE